MSFIKVLKLLIGIVVAIAFSAPALAEEIKLGCLTQRVWLRDGVPPVMIATFDEQAKSATLFAKELGGILKGESVEIDQNMVMFKITTKSDEAGDVTIMRSDGTLMLIVKRQPEIKILADCRKQSNRF